ncbi:probable mediator of RNA polymerase II transcription subunit 26c [Morus notabilis]|uniref:probable mediator of RNA polymerase II transcription subunit 26c n=1 Tax=Morus notabilis TaxID=981085 RepID=UPI000CED7CF0|nr:probable mediator of RNA polymerase II transcription subunit 26c [Morus notabilis]
MLDILVLQQQLQQNCEQGQQKQEETEDQQAKESHFVDQHFPNCFDTEHGNGSILIESEKDSRDSDLPPGAEKLVAGKALPEKGKLLQAVMEAGPLLQTLLLAGPLPQWQHPPPRVDTIEIPPVAISRTPPLTFLLHDSCFSHRRSLPHSDHDSLLVAGRVAYHQAEIAFNYMHKGEKKPRQVAAPDWEQGLDPYGGLFDDEQKKILEIKEQLEDSDQSEDTLVELLQSLVDMDITFQALKETDIGRHVNRLRKHSSSEVKRLVKQVVRWRFTPTESSPKWSSPDGSSGSDKNNSEPERKPKAVPSRREALPKPTTPSVPQSAHSTPQNRQREQREGSFDAEKLASARKRLQENYKEAENAKKQITIQVMDIHEIPKPKAKNAFFPKNKGGGDGSLGRHW